MLLIWSTFWLTYFIMGSLFYHDRFSLSKMVITTRTLLNNISGNALTTLLLSLMTNLLPCMQMALPKTFIGYGLHVLFALIVGDLCSYGTHRLLHTHYFYHYHKIHHQYIVPHSLVGVYSHPLEMAFNYIAILIGLTSTSSYNDYTLMLETVVVAMGILLSHRANVNLWVDAGAKMHNLHHQHLNCNYGFTMIVDWLFGTLQL